MSLPNPQAFITDLFNSFPTQLAPTTASNALKDVPPSIKPIMITLHVLFPNEFLPALDVLDRNLVTRFHIQLSDDVPSNIGGTLDKESVTSRHGQASGSEADAPMHVDRGSEYPVYFVGSAQAQNQYQSRHHQNALPTTSYEVRTLSWNCSCPAFAFSAFPAIEATPCVDPLAEKWNAEINEDQEWFFRFGGLSNVQGSIPVCKHLLACVLVERCSSIFGGCVEEKTVSIDELAGWCAGWGE